MIPLSAGWLADNDYLPHYTHTQAVTGIAVLGAIAVVTAVAFIVVQCRRGR